jgi:hypothetical protein
VAPDRRSGTCCRVDPIETNDEKIIDAVFLDGPRDKAIYDGADGGHEIQASTTTAVLFVWRARHTTSASDYRDQDRLALLRNST